ncbi:hypothetical protein BHE74_00036809 [Ensete ventricosum]|nr:hypothetical protein BHE74_00036809 [Ensete ventricosum]
MASARVRGADLVEIRLDHLAVFHPRRDPQLLLKNRPLPALVTYRCDWDLRCVERSMSNSGREERKDQGKESAPGQPTISDLLNVYNIKQIGPDTKRFTGKDASISPLVGKTFIVIGAGGAGKALAYGARENGAKVVIANRSYEAEEAGATVVSGMEMFLRLAIGQFELFTGLAGRVGPPHRRRDRNHCVPNIKLVDAHPPEVVFVNVGEATCVQCPTR